MSGPVVRVAERDASSRAICAVIHCCLSVHTTHYNTQSSSKASILAGVLATCEITYTWAQLMNPHQNKVMLPVCKAIGRNEWYVTGACIARYTHPKTKPAPRMKITPGKKSATFTVYTGRNSAQPFQLFCFSNHLSMVPKILKPWYAYTKGNVASQNRVQ